jgi:hypothetical protein
MKKYRCEVCNDRISPCTLITDVYSECLDYCPVDGSNASWQEVEEEVNDVDRE